MENKKTTLKEKQRQEGLERLRMLNVLGKVRQDFARGKLYYSERQNSFFNAVLYWVDNNPTWLDKIKKFESKNKVMVYHAQLTHLECGDCLSLLYVSKDEEEWENERDDLRKGMPFVKTIDPNAEDDYFSEYGYIGIKPSMGGVARIS